MNCPDCGAYAGEEDLFCGECGRPLPKERPTDEPLVPEKAEKKVGPVLALPRPPAAGTSSPVLQAKDTQRAARTGLGLVGVLAVGLFLLARVLSRAILAPDATPAPAAMTPASLVPDATPTPAVMTSAPGAVVYQDDFEDPPSGWLIDSDEDTAVLYEDGEYRVAVSREQYVAWGNPTPAQDLGDFQIEVDARAVEGPLNNNLGILVRYQDDDNTFYWFQISSDGYFAVDRLAGDEWVTIAGWQESAAIKQGLGETNRLKVICSGDRFDFFVNDTYLATVTDGNLGRGSIGLAAGTFDEAGVAVHFDNLRVYAPQK